MEWIGGFLGRVRQSKGDAAGIIWAGAAVLVSKASAGAKGRGCFATGPNVGEICAWESRGGEGNATRRSALGGKRSAASRGSKCRRVEGAKGRGV